MAPTAVGVGVDPGLCSIRAARIVIFTARKRSSESRPSRTSVDTNNRSARQCLPLNVSILASSHQRIDAANPEDRVVIDWASLSTSFGVTRIRVENVRISRCHSSKTAWNSGRVISGPASHDQRSLPLALEVAK